VVPTIFGDVKSDMTIGQEEIFGPVLALIKVNTVEQAIELANDIPYGLSSSIFTKNIGNALQFIVPPKVIRGCPIHCKAVMPLLRLS